MSASLLPPESNVGRYLQCPSIDSMKELLAHSGIKFSPRMITEVQRELRAVKDYPDVSFSSSQLENRIVQCELLLAKALHDNPDHAIDIPLKAGSMGMDVDATAWNTEEMQAEAERIWAMGKPAAKILNDPSKTFLFMRKILSFLAEPNYFQHDFSKEICWHMEEWGENDDGNTVSFATERLGYGKFVFAYGNMFFNTAWDAWIHLPFSLPDIETLECWYQNYMEHKCFAGGSLSFWFSQSSICQCLPEKCHIDNPQCPLRDTFHRN